MCECSACMSCICHADKYKYDKATNGKQKHNITLDRLFWGKVVILLGNKTVKFPPESNLLGGKSDGDICLPRNSSCIQTFEGTICWRSLLRKTSVLLGNLSKGTKYPVVN